VHRAHLTIFLFSSHPHRWVWLRLRGVAYYPFLDPTIPAPLTVPFCFLILIGGLGLRVRVRGIRVRVRDI